MKFTKYLVILTASLFVICGPANSDECSNAQTQFQINNCTAVAFQKADDELNAVWAQVRQTFAKDGYGKRSKAELLKSQRAWIAYRKAECDGSVGQDWEGGTGRPMAVNLCGTELTKQRTKRLRERFLSR